MSEAGEKESGEERPHAGARPGAAVGRLEPTHCFREMRERRRAQYMFPFERAHSVLRIGARTC
eukprot:9763440-Alexandrium_andersonii.AAC.1